MFLPDSNANDGQTNAGASSAWNILTVELEIKKQSSCFDQSPKQPKVDFGPSDYSLPGDKLCSWLIIFFITNYLEKVLWTRLKNIPRLFHDIVLSHFFKSPTPPPKKKDLDLVFDAI